MARTMMLTHPAPLLQSSWRFHNPVKLTVGRGCRQQLHERLYGGGDVLVVTTRRGRRQLLEDRLLRGLPESCRLHWVDSIKENPSLQDLQAEITRLHDISFEAVIAFGGGSALDAGKVLNLALQPACRRFSLQELLLHPECHAQVCPAPLYALPTTAGTGSEVTPFATIWDHARRKKLSLAGPNIFPAEAFVDADLADALPPHVTLSTGLDAINQAAESIWNKHATSITLGYASRALQLGFEALPALCRGGGDLDARSMMAEASLLSGLAISHTRTALCHSISYPLTAHFGIPHGLACAFTMPAVLRHNLHAEDGRFAELARNLIGTHDLDRLQYCFDDLHAELNVRRAVRQFIPSLEALLILEREMFTPGRADNNLQPIHSLKEILVTSWG